MKNQKGITLIALVITIIVMLILVGVSVTVALNGGLFTTAKTAAEGTKVATEKERLLEITLGTLDNKGKVDRNKLNTALNGTEFTPNADGTYTSTKTEIKYEISERGSVTEKPVLKILPKKATYTVGEEVTIGNENFYVIANTADTVTLLAKYNIKADGTSWIQDSTGATNACAFIATADTISAPDKADEYGEKFEVDGVTGRLPTLDDLKPLGLTIADNDDFGSTAACNTNGYSFVNSTDKGAISYWLADPSRINNLYGICVVGSSSGGSTTNDMLDGSFGLAYGVRPVLVVSKSAI